MSEDPFETLRKIMADIEESLRQHRMTRLPSALRGGRQNGKASRLPMWIDEAQQLAPAPGTVEHVAAKYATEPSHQVAGIVHRAEHYGVDYRGNR